MLERISEKFYNKGIFFDEFINSGTKEEQQRFQLYYDRFGRLFPPDEFRIDLNYPINLVIVAATWCWDCKTNLPVFIRVAEHNTNISLKIFNKDEYPFLIDRINGGEKVPQVLIFSKDFYYIDRWVERPTLGYQLYSDVRKEFGWEKDTSKEFTEEYRKRYFKQQENILKGLIQEIRVLFKRIDLIQASTSRFFSK